MNNLIEFPKLKLFIIIILMVNFMYGCSKEIQLSDAYFPGKWKSSKISTPIVLYENGEWEILGNNGEVVQYGVWQYYDQKILWSFLNPDSGRILHDNNVILSASPERFTLKESNGKNTTFDRLK